MSNDGSLALAVALFTVVGAAVLLALSWDRAPAVARAGLALAAVFGVGAAAALQVNRLTAAPPPVPAGDPMSTTGSRLLAVLVNGRASGLTLPMYVYLPADYRLGHTRFPVIEALYDHPGSPIDWLQTLNARSYLDEESAAGRMAPTVVLFPGRTDSECIDLRGGGQVETFLTVDVPAYAGEHFRVRNDRVGWGLIGYATGAFCAINLALRHPGEYAAAAALSGYAEPGVAIGDGSEQTTNNPAWRLRHLPQPPTALWLGWGADDKKSAAGSRRLAAEARPPLAVTTTVVDDGGHDAELWRRLEPPAFDWLSARLAGPIR